jgi:hypothetical protein
VRQPAGRHLRASQAVGGVSGGETDSDIILRHDGGAVLVEQRVSTGVIAVVMRVDQILDGQRRELLDGGLDLIVERREFAVHHYNAVRAYCDGDVPALTLEHIGLVAKIRCLDLDFREIDVLLRVCGSDRQYSSARKSGECDAFHDRCPTVMGRIARNDADGVSATL